MLLLPPLPLRERVDRAKREPGEGSGRSLGTPSHKGRGKKKKKPLDLNPILGLYSRYPASTTEGRLISTPDAEAGRGGRLGALEMRRRIPRRRSKPRRVRRAVRTPGPPDGPVGRSACLSAHARPSGRGPPVERRGVCNGRSERTGLPPRPARSKPINIARGTPSVWWTCVSNCFDKPRCREASRRVGPSGPLAFRAPSDFEGGQSWKTAYPGPVKNTGAFACLLHPPMEGEGRLIARDPPPPGEGEESAANTTRENPKLPENCALRWTPVFGYIRALSRSG